MNSNNYSHEMMDNDAKKLHTGVKVSSTNGAGKTGIMQNNEISSVSIIMNKNKLQMDQLSQGNTWNAEISRRKPRKYPIT